jgi:hypothetical protein
MATSGRSAALSAGGQRCLILFIFSITTARLRSGAAATPFYPDSKVPFRCADPGGGSLDLGELPRGRFPP